MILPSSYRMKIFTPFWAKIFPASVELAKRSGTVELSKPGSKVKVYKVETNEELVIARDTYRLTK